MAATFLCVAGAGAQSLRGLVVLSDSVTPVRGGIVVLESPSGDVVTRALSDERGGFVLRPAAFGSYRLRALRIGYQPTLVPSVAVSATSSAPLRVVLGSVAVALPKIAVRGEDICRGQSADGAVVAAVWEEARKALLASGLSSSEQPLMAEWIEYERTLDTTARVVRHQKVQSTRAATTHAFRSAPSRVLADSGYVIDAADGTVFHAPDADVLLSESFASLHCFHVEPPEKGREQLIGVGFKPARERRRISDIEGTFWIDRASSELRSLEYRYTGLPSVTDRVRPGGAVEFLRLPSGSWLVNRWSIRMPQLVVTTPKSAGRRGITVTTSATAVTGVRLVGGEVLNVSRGDSTLFRADGAAFTVRLHAADSLVSLADARVSLEGTDYELLTTPEGVATIAPVLPGQYRVHVQSPFMDSLGVTMDPIDVTVRPADRRETPIPLLSSTAMLRRVCGDNYSALQGAHVRGVVVDSLGLPVPDAAVRLRWQQQVSIIKDRLVWNEQSVTTRSDSLGLWQMCGVRRDASVIASVESAAGVGRTTFRVPESALFASTRVLVKPAIVVGAAATREASMVVTVTDGALRPLRDALVQLTQTGSPPLRLRTDTSGRAGVPRLNSGIYAVEIRKVGYASGTLSAEVEAGENTLPIVLETSTTPTLAAVRVVGDRMVIARHADFERRRLSGEATAIITEEEIDKRKPPHSWQLLTRVPSLLVLDSLGFVYARSSRMATYVCWPRVAVDGKILLGRPNLAVELPPPSEIYAIEVFAGSARLPIEIPGEGDQRFCGLIAIWTK